MSLRLKTLLITAMTLTTLLLVLTVSLRSILLESYRQIEEQDALQNLDRGVNAFMGSLDHMDRTTQDYSYWDDLYRYMITKDRAFADVNLVDSTFSNTRWNLLLLFNPEGKNVYAGAFDLDAKASMDVPEAWKKAIESRLPRLKPETDKAAVRGLLQVPEGVMMIVAREILQSNLSGPSQGLMVTGRLLSGQENRLLAEQTRLNLRWQPLSQAQLDGLEQELTKGLKTDHARAMRPMNDKELLAIELIHDLDGQPALYMMLVLPRTIFMQGQKSLYYLISAVVICASVFSVMILWLLERFVLARMSRLSAEVVALGEGQDLSRRITGSGQDEIGQLSVAINRMLTTHEDLHVLLEREKGKSERLLHNVLPDAIATRLKESSGVIAESYAEVTILFADIVDFTTMSTQVSPEYLVNMLNEVFSAFDHLAEKHGLEKIKTIGDAYMVVGGLPEKREDHAEAVTRMALDMLAVLEDISRTRGQRLQVRIGINTGPVVAGVIGTKKFLYDLWGDTVNTASRMESSGIPGKIQVTEATLQRLEGRFQIQALGERDIKGKGRIPVFLVLDETRRKDAA
ncbi:MAG TPA: adenylate/guanylate cyclase domain-containing protein [Oligoflexus sp.]|uniref:adenylate/guanylate cyclase domain-containing protein n=1 Tax=Oligoflexus sp. TaxID=1971216 RepID=UPI002D7E5EB4|nr:adenylate/guanylate cyclase domain-containing protein [Oligoflexus sp.]HET9240436.1 adenylate/guanylate cyclase domain-containing protein [Oligoflexus sp.]